MITIYKSISRVWQEYYASQYYFAFQSYYASNWCKAQVRFFFPNIFSRFCVLHSCTNFVFLLCFINIIFLEFNKIFSQKHSCNCKGPIYRYPVSQQPSPNPILALSDRHTLRARVHPSLSLRVNLLPFFVCLKCPLA